jgi:hypothetical protein
MPMLEYAAQRTAAEGDVTRAMAVMNLATPPARVESHDSPLTTLSSLVYI